MNRYLRSVSGEKPMDKKQIFVKDDRGGEINVKGAKEKGLAPHIARSESGGYTDTKSLRFGNKGGKGKETGPNRESIKPPPLEISKNVANETARGSSRWSTELDETSGDIYYYDNNTHETTWEKPDDLEIRGGVGGTMSE